MAGAGGVAGSSGSAGSGGLSGEAGVGGEQAGGAPQGGAGASALGGLGGGGGASGGGLGGMGSGGSGGAVDPALCKSFWVKPAFGSAGKPLWRDTQGFQVFSEFGAVGAPDRFALVTLSPDNGEQILHRGYDVVPTEAKGSFFSVQDLTYDDQGNFAVLAQPPNWVKSNNAPRFVGHLDPISMPFLLTFLSFSFHFSLCTPKPTWPRPNLLLDPARCPGQGELGYRCLDKMRPIKAQPSSR